MRKVLKITVIAAILMLALISIFSCKTTEYITKVEKQTDTIEVEKIIIDSTSHKSTKEITKPTKSDLFLPCPETENESGSSGKNESGENYAKWQYDKEKGGYNVELYCAEQISIFDSINKKLSIENSLLKIHSSIKISEKATIKENSNWWQSVLKNIWKVLFFTVLLLWIFGITPKFILKKIL